MQTGLSHLPFSNLLCRCSTSLSDVACLVIDEYDRLLSGPLKVQTAAIASQVSPSSCQRVLVSATVPCWLHESPPWAEAVSHPALVGLRVTHVKRNDLPLANADLFVECPWLRQSVLHFDARGATHSSGNDESIDLSSSKVKPHLVPPTVKLSVKIVSLDGVSSDGLKETAVALWDLLWERSQSYAEPLSSAPLESPGSFLPGSKSGIVKALVFVETRLGCEKLSRALGLAADAKKGVRKNAPELVFLDTLHGGRDQTERFRALRRFKTHDEHVDSKGGMMVLVCTDVAARGLHVEGVTDVISLLDSWSDALGESIAERSDFDEENVRQLVHRIGRVGRAGEEGHAHCLFPVSKDLATGESSASRACHAAAIRLHQLCLDDGQLPPEELDSLIQAARFDSETSGDRVKQQELFHPASFQSKPNSVAREVGMHME